METEEFAVNVTNNFTDFDLDDREEFQWDTFYARLSLEFFTVVALLSAAANFLIIYTIIKFKKLRNEVTNQIFLHLNIVQLVYLIFTPLTMRVFLEFDLISHFSMKVYCVMNELEIAIFISIGLLLVLLICDWYIKVHSEDNYAKFGKAYKFCIAVVYIVIACEGSVTAQFCIRGIYPYPTILITSAEFFLITLFLIVMNIIHRVKIRRNPNLLSKDINNVGLSIANIFALLWCPTIFIIILAIFGIAHVIPLIIFTTLGFSSPVFNLWYFYRYDNQFNIFFRKVVTCKCNDYKNERLEDHSVTYNDANSTVQI